MSAISFKKPEQSDPEAWLQRHIDQAKYERSAEYSVEISPVMAQVMLRRNSGNRRVYQSHVQGLAAAIKRGDWVQTHNGIAFDRNGRLLDGQHRLEAVVLSGLAVRLDVHFGEAPESFDRIDVGRNRSAANLLEIGGHKNATMIAAIGRILKSLEAGLLYVERVTTSNHEILQYVSERAGILEASRIAQNMRESIGRMQSPAGFGAAVFLIQKRVGTDADDFFERLKTSVGFKSEFDAVLQLKKRLQKSTGAKLDAIEVCALTIKAFNYWHEGRAIKVLVWRAVDEPFPKVGE